MINFVPTRLNDLVADVSLSGAARGDLFYRGASRWGNLAAGAAGNLLASGGAGADPAWAAALTYAATGTHLSVASQGAAVIPVAVRAASGQTAPLQSWQGSDGNSRMAVIYPNPSQADSGPLIRCWRADGAVFQDLYLDQSAGSNWRMTGELRLSSTIRFDSAGLITGNGTTVGSSTGSPVTLQSAHNGNATGSGFICNTTTAPTAGLVFQVRKNGTNLFDMDFAGLIGVRAADAATSAVTSVLTLDHATSGTAAAGFGSGVRARLQSSTTAAQDAGLFAFAWSVATHASRTSQGSVHAVTNAAGLAEVARFDGGGGATPAAGNTGLMLYDVDNGTLERVTVGAADSGGAGFKVLRIPN